MSGQHRDPKADQWGPGAPVGFRALLLAAGPDPSRSVQTTPVPPIGEYVATAFDSDLSSYAVTFISEQE